MSAPHTVACVRRLDDDQWLETDADAVVPLASVGKLLLLGEVASRVASGTLRLDDRLPLLDQDRAVGGTGLLASLSPTSWTVQDLVRAVAAVSDNAATNVLLRAVSLDALGRLALTLGLVHTRVHDQIRSLRGPALPPQFATGTTRELAHLLAAVAQEAFVSPEASRLLRSWLRLNIDRSLVADPVVHAARSGRTPDLANKTGTDAGVLADAGLVEAGGWTVVYAVVTTFSPSASPPAQPAAVASLRYWGEVVNSLASEPPPVC